MSLDPRTYDVQELRALAGRSRSRPPTPRSDPAEPGDTRTRRPPARHQSDAVARGAQFKKALTRQRGMPASPETRGRPFLETLPDGPVAETTVTDWLGYLVDGGGRRRAADALAYYRQIGWISPPVESALRDRLAGFHDPQHARALTVADHRVALVAIQRLVSCANHSDGARGDATRSDPRRERTRSPPRHQ
ncbi:FlaD/FlaE family flagellar protein [Haloparvum sp. AD34]